MRNVKKLLAALMAAVMLLCVMMISVMAEGAEDFTFELREDGQGYVVADYHGEDASVTVPDWYENLPVVAIGRGAFQDNSVITKVVLPSSILVIGAAAFKNCTALATLSSYTAAVKPPQQGGDSERVAGDADGSGEVDIMDALAILQYAVGWDVAMNLSSADVNADNAVDIMDALAILQYTVGWNVELL